MKIGQRVKLKDNIDPAFTGGFGRVGNEAVIRQTQTDQYGFETVLVEYDHAHWSYNGAEDGWTFANHFEVVDTPSVDPEEAALAWTPQPQQQPSQANPITIDRDVLEGMFLTLMQDIIGSVCQELEDRGVEIVG